MRLRARGMTACPPPHTDKGRLPRPRPREDGSAILLACVMRSSPAASPMDRHRTARFRLCDLLRLALAQSIYLCAVRPAGRTDGFGNAAPSSKELLGGSRCRRRGSEASTGWRRHVVDRYARKGVRSVARRTRHRGWRGDRNDDRRGGWMAAMAAWRSHRRPGRHSVERALGEGGRGRARNRSSQGEGTGSEWGPYVVMSAKAGAARRIPESATKTLEPNTWFSSNHFFADSVARTSQAKRIDYKRGARKDGLRTKSAAAPSSPSRPSSASPSSSSPSHAPSSASSSPACCAGVGAPP